jgi:hypothetical protein
LPSQIPKALWCLLPGLLAFFASAGSLRAELRFERTVVDAGMVYTGRALVCSFGFVNAGASVVEIRDIIASCGCLTPQLRQRTYEAGKSGNIDLEVNTFSQADGPHTWALHVQFRDGDRLGKQILELHARLVTEVRVQPAALVLIADREASHGLTITDRRPTPLAIKEARSSLKGLSVKVAPPELDPEKHWLYRATVQVTEDLPNGRHDGFIEFVTGDPRYELLRVPITVSKRYQQRLAATPAEVTLIAPPGQPVPSRLVLIRDQEGGKVHIDAVTADDPTVRCRWADGPGQLGTVRIQADRSGVHGESETIVRVQLTQPLPASLVIPVRCVAH